MNKDVIYIEPEDDITDIISSLKTAKQKVVALVPPQKTGVLSSAVNIKLIARTAKSLNKSVVIVTSEPALVKLALFANLPVAKTLQSRPMIPTEAQVAAVKEELIVAEAKSKEKLAPDDALEATTPKDHPVTKSSDGKNPETITSRELKSSKKSKKSIPDFKKYQKFVVLGSALLVLLGGFLYWALAIAPAVSIAVEVRATAQNFSENVSFTSKNQEEDVGTGKFFLEEHKYSTKSEIEFEATGQKDIGDPAKGELTIYAYLSISKPSSITVPAGSIFTANQLNFTTDQKVDFSLTSTSLSGLAQCENKDSENFAAVGCLKSKTVKVTATQPGTSANLEPLQASSWSNKLGLGLKSYNKQKFSGGSSKMVTVVQESDIKKATEKLDSESETSGKTKLFEQVPNTVLLIESSFKRTNADPVSIPKLGEVLEEGKKAKLESASIFSVYSVDRVRLEEFIKNTSKPKLGHDQKIYSIGKPFFERFLKDEKGNFSAKLKTTIQVGPEVTEQIIMERSRGRKIGEVQHLIKSINGVSTVNIDPAYFWVNSVPNDPNKVKINLKVEE